MSDSPAPLQGERDTSGPQSADPTTTLSPDLAIKVVRKPNIGRLAGAAVVLVLVVACLWSMVNNPRFHWDIVGQWLVARSIAHGLLLTLWLTALSMTAGTALGIVLAVLGSSKNPVLSKVAAAYVWFFRGTPLLVQLLFWFNMSAVYPRIVIGLPFGGPEFASLSANSVITPAMAAFLGLALHESAYMAEIVRAGILSVPQGQKQAATALGMRRMQTMRRIVLPQAMRVIIPPTGNQTISMLKTTSLVSVLAIPDLLYSAQISYSRNFQTIPLLIVATILYLITVSVLTLGQTWVERRFSPDAHRRADGRLRAAVRRHTSDGRPA